MSATLPASDIHTLAAYLHKIKNEISPIKLQKSLYFLYAYYGALYGKDEEVLIFEGTSVGTPNCLFDADFESWKYGPVNRDVYFKNKNGYYDQEKQEIAIKELEKNPELKSFIDDLFSQIDEHSDFTLVERSHNDSAWQTAYKIGESTIIDKDCLIKEYRENYI